MVEVVVVEVDVTVVMEELELDCAAAVVLPLSKANCITASARAAKNNAVSVKCPPAADLGGGILLPFWALHNVVIDGQKPLTDISNMNSSSSMRMLIRKHYVWP